MRIGQGFDVHQFAPNRDLWICGVKVPHEFGLLGHSDADVAIHALCDALLGALALGDIGKLFPDSDPAFKGIDSKILLRHVCDKIADSGWSIGNVDITVIAQVPKFRPYIDEMRATLSKVMEININQVSVKATTTEQLGFTGRKEGIAAQAVALLTSNSEPLIPNSIK